ncbi:unnamed protein product, partial [Nesidiocoris tenuis]
MTNPFLSRTILRQFISILSFPWIRYLIRKTSQLVIAQRQAWAATAGPKDSAIESSTPGGLSRRVSIPVAAVFDRLSATRPRRTDPPRRLSAARRARQPPGCNTLRLRKRD